MVLFRRNVSHGCLREDFGLSRFRRPSLPVIPQHEELSPQEMTSSIGHQRSRRPSLADTYRDPPNRNCYSMDDMVIYADFPDVDNITYPIQCQSRMLLWQAFEEALRVRGMNVNDVQFYLMNSNTPLPETSLVECLAGQRIIVKEAKGREAMRVGRHSRAAHSMDDSPGERPSRKMSAEAVARKASFVNQRIISKSRHHSENKLNGSEEGEGRSNDSSQRDINLMDDASCSSDIIYPDDGGTRRARSAVGTSRISLFFGKEREMINRLCQLKEDTPPADRMFYLEDNWKQIVQDPQELSQRSAARQEAIWELISTEQNYIKMLKHMLDLKSYLIDLIQCGFMKSSDVDVNKIFSLYDQLYAIHCQYWNISILPMLAASRERGIPLDAAWFEKWFGEVEDWCQVYNKYIVSKPGRHYYVQKRRKDNTAFEQFVNWAESQDTMKRQKLTDIQAAPVQQLTRYSLHLTRVLQSYSDELERDLLQGMKERVDLSIYHLNHELNNSDIKEKLEDINRSIDGYDCIDADEYEKIAGAPHTINLASEMGGVPFEHRYRRLFHRGELKIRESKQGQKIDVYCFVFTDMFLICRKKADRLRIYRPPWHITKLIYKNFDDATLGFYLGYQSDFGSMAHLYYVFTNGFDETRRWLEMIDESSKEFKRLAGFPIRPPIRMHYDSPISDSTRNPLSSYAYHPSVIHRKSSSMDSQAVAVQSHSRQMDHIHRIAAVSSTEQLNRHAGRDSPSRLNQHKLSVASCNANLLSSSKSSVDLHVGMPAETGHDERPRSRSNSSGLDIDGSKSRSPSPQRRNGENGSECTPPDDTQSPTLLVTTEDEPPPASSRRFEKRYHTSDAIDMKPKAGPNIFKRLSWNVGSAMGASSRKISARLGDHSRRNSQASQASQVSAAVSSESFGSSTSGISSSSDSCLIEMAKTHISTIAVNESPSESTLNISLDLPEETEPEQLKPLSLRSPPAPPLPQIPPPLETSTCKQELLKIIFDHQLETSDV